MKIFSKYNEKNNYLSFKNSTTKNFSIIFWYRFSTFSFSKNNLQISIARKISLAVILRIRYNILIWDFSLSGISWLPFDPNSRCVSSDCNDILDWLGWSPGGECGWFSDFGTRSWDQCDFIFSVGLKINNLKISDKNGGAKPCVKTENLTYFVEKLRFAPFSSLQGSKIWFLLPLVDQYWQNCHFSYQIWRFQLELLDHLLQSHPSYQHCLIR